MALVRTFSYPLFCFTLPLPKQSYVLCFASWVLCSKWDALRHCLALSCPSQSQRGSCTRSSCAWLTQPRFPSSELRVVCLLPYSLWFCGERDNVSGCASSLGATRRSWIMCLFFNSIKKPTSKIPFSFFLDLGHSASCP